MGRIPRGAAIGCLPLWILRCQSRRRLGNHGDLSLPRERRSHHETSIRQLDTLRLLIARSASSCSRSPALVVWVPAPWKVGEINIYVISIGRLSKSVLRIGDTPETLVEYMTKKVALVACNGHDLQFVTLIEGFSTYPCYPARARENKFT